MKNLFAMVAWLPDFINTSWNLPVHGLVMCLAVVGLAVGGAALTAQAFTAEEADTICAAHTRTFYRSAMAALIT